MNKILVCIKNGGKTRRVTLLTSGLLVDTYPPCMVYPWIVFFWVSVHQTSCTCHEPLNICPPCIFHLDTLQPCISLCCHDKLALFIKKMVCNFSFLTIPFTNPEDCTFFFFYKNLATCFFFLLCLLFIFRFFFT